jgi:hypothetical protein
MPESRTEQIHAAIIAIMRAVGPIAKNQKNTQQNYNFRGVDDVYNAVYPHFSEHGVYSTSEVLDQTHNSIPRQGKSPILHAILRMRFTFHAADGSSVSTEVIGEGMDYGGDKASNKAMSVADKYAILQLLKIPTALADPDIPPEFTAKPQSEHAPQAQPRGERVDKKELRKVWDRWIEVTGQPADAKRSDFEEWCEIRIPGLERKHASDVNAWSASLVSAAHAALDGILGIPAATAKPPATLFKTEEIPY